MASSNHDLPSVWSGPDAPAAPAATIPPPVPPGVAGDPLGPEQWQELTTALGELVGLRRVISIASFNAWTAAVLAGLSVLLAVTDPLGGLLAAAALAVVSWNEFRGRRQLRRLNPKGSVTLGCNQLLLIALIASYGTWKILAAIHGPDPYAGQLDALRDSPAFQDLLKNLGSLHVIIAAVVYGSVIVLVSLVQGVNAVYYFAQGPRLRTHLATRPAWIIRIERMMLSPRRGRGA